MGEISVRVCAAGSKTRDIASLPVYRGDLQVQADWGQTKIDLDRARKLVRLRIPTPTWKGESGPVVHIAVANQAVWSGKYAVGESIPVSLVHVGGQPNMYFEVIDENESAPIYVIGFKKDG